MKIDKSTTYRFEPVSFIQFGKVLGILPDDVQDLLTTPDDNGETAIPKGAVITSITVETDIRGRFIKGEIKWKAYGE